jgi:ankyrin repeat protein
MAVMAGTWTPLFIAVESQNVEQTLLLLQAGVNVRELGGNPNWTPLRMAVLREDPVTVDLLCRYGADADQRIEGNATLLHLNTYEWMGMGGADLQPERERRLTDVARQLIHHGVDVSARENRGLTALQMAARNCHIAMVGVMLDCQDVDPEQRATDGLGTQTDGQTAEEMVTHLLAAKLALATPENIALDINRQGDIDASREILAMLRAEPVRRRERRAAFAMALIPRLGVASPVKALDPELVRMVLETP